MQVTGLKVGKGVGVDRVHEKLEKRSIRVIKVENNISG
jgi:hypothetical protein